MTDTDRLSEILAPRVEAALEVFTRACAPIIRELELGAAAAGRVFQQSMAESAQRWQVHTMMPRLSLRGVLVHGLVPLHQELTA